MMCTWETIWKLKRMLSDNASPVASGQLLPLQFGSKRLLSLGHVMLVSFRINKWIRAAISHTGEFSIHTVVISVRTEKNVARQGFQDMKSGFVILCNLGIRRIRDQFITPIHIDTANYDHVVHFSAVFNFECPSGAALRVAWRLARNQFCVSEFDFVPVV